MADVSASKNLSLSHGSVKIQARHNKKFQCALVFVDFETSQKDLLCLLLQKYAEEKRLFAGINMNNAIYSAIVGETSIALLVPENKITNNIALLVSYLHKTELKSMENRFIHSGDYAKLSSDIQSFDVIVTGKCKNFVDSLKANKPKIENLVNQLNACEPKQREKFNNTNVVESAFGRSISFDGGNNLTKLYASIVLEDIPAKITNSGIVLLSPRADERLAEKLLFKSTFQGKVKSFLTQTGAVGSPAANDAGGAKFKAKADNILKCQNMLAEVYSKLRGFNFSFSNAEDLKKVDSPSLTKVKAVRV